MELFVSVSALLAAGEIQRLKIIYSSFTGGYTPLWIAVDEGGRKYGLDIEAIYAASRQDSPRYDVGSVSASQDSRS